MQVGVFCGPRTRRDKRLAISATSDVFDNLVKVYVTCTLTVMGNPDIYQLSLAEVWLAMNLPKRNAALSPETKDLDLGRIGTVAEKEL